MTRRIRSVPALLLAGLVLWTGAALAQSSPSDSPWYEVAQVNPGLGPVPDTIDRTTPRAAMESFLDHAARDDWAAAAHVLDLAGWPMAEQAGRGPDLARRLFTVIDRKVVVNWFELLDRPDALDARASAEAAMSGQPRRSLMLALVALEDRPVSIRINRLKPDGGDPVWVFSRQTVENVPALYALYGPSKLEEMLPDLLRERAFWGLRWWEVIGLPLVIALAVGLGRLTYMAMSQGMGRTRRDSGSSSLLVALRPPAILTVVAGTLAVCTQSLFLFSGRIDTVLSPLVAIGFVAAVIWAIVNVADAVMDRLVSFDGDALTATGEGQEKKRELATKVAAIRRAMIVIVTIFGIGIVLREANLMQTLGFSLLASAGAFTLILAFAARNILANILASLQIALNQSARIGDRIVYRGHMCSVERINFTFVQLREWTGKRIIVPVIEFVAEPFENWTMIDPALIGEVRLRLSHDADFEALRDRYEAIMDEVDNDEERDRAGERGVYVTDHHVLGPEVLFLIPCADPNTAWARTCDLRERLLGAAADVSTEARPAFPPLTAAEAL